MRDAKARSEAKLVGVQQTGRPAVLAADKRDQLAVFDGQISEWMGGRVYVMQRTHVLIPEAHFDSRVVVRRQLSCTYVSAYHWRRSMEGIPLAWRWRTAGRPSSKLARALPVPSPVAVWVVKPFVNW